MLQQRQQPDRVFVRGAVGARARCASGRAIPCPSWTAKTTLVLPASMASSMALRLRRPRPRRSAADAARRWRAAGCHPRRGPRSGRRCRAAPSAQVSVVPSAGPRASQAARIGAKPSVARCVAARGRARRAGAAAKASGAGGAMPARRGRRWRGRRPAAQGQVHADAEARARRCRRRPRRWPRPGCRPALAPSAAGRSAISARARAGRAAWRPTRLGQRHGGQQPPLRRLAQRARRAQQDREVEVARAALPRRGPACRARRSAGAPGRRAPPVRPPRPAAQRSEVRACSAAPAWTRRPEAVRRALTPAAPATARLRRRRRSGAG